MNHLNQEMLNQRMMRGALTGPAVEEISTMRRCNGVMENGRRCSVVPIPGHEYCKACEAKEARGEMPALAVVKLPVEPLRAHNLKPKKSAVKTIISGNKLPETQTCANSQTDLSCLSEHLHFHPTIGDRYPCGTTIYVDKSVADWADVTCENCLVWKPAATEPDHPADLGVCFNDDCHAYSGPDDGGNCANYPIEKTGTCPDFQPMASPANFPKTDHLAGADKLIEPGKKTGLSDRWTCNLICDEPSDNCPSCTRADDGPGTIIDGQLSKTVWICGERGCLNPAVEDNRYCAHHIETLALQIQPVVATPPQEQVTALATPRKGLAALIAAVPVPPAPPVGLHIPFSLDEIAILSEWEVAPEHIRQFVVMGLEGLLCHVDNMDPLAKSRQGGV